jgi:drug/metabolite transporter (DMT)-like permease
MSHFPFVLILLTVAFTVIGQMLVKQGAMDLGGSPGRLAQVPAFLWRASTNWHVILGLASAGVAAAAWVMALSRSDLSLAYPFIGLSIVLVLAMSGFVFGERVPWTRWLGAMIVCLGIWVASR